MRVPFPIRVASPLTFRAWLTPPPLGRATASRDRESIADLERVHFGGVPGYEIGIGPVVVAVHGWGGRTAQMAPIARRLADEGYRVVVPELPGHAGGPPTDIKRGAAAIQDVIDDVGNPQVIVGHSFAGMVLRLAFEDGAPRRVILVAPALDVRDALQVFSERLRLLPWARRGLRERLERWDRSLWPTMASICPHQLPGAEILIAHDPQDDDTPFARSAELAAIRPGTTIVALQDAGHSQILTSPELLDLVADFVRDPAVAGDSAA